MKHVTHLPKANMNKCYFLGFNDLAKRTAVGLLYDYRLERSNPDIYGNVIRVIYIYIYI